MSEVYVHGVVRADDRVEVSAAPVRLVAHGPVAALVSDAGDGARTASDALRRHWRVLEEAIASATVLPVRFGTAMAGDRAVVDEFLAPRQDRLEASLADMAGKVQLSLKGEYEEGLLLRGVVEGSPTIARLRERVRAVPEAAGYYDRIRLGELIAGAVESTREHDSAYVLGRLEPLAVATSREATSSVNSAVDAAFLIERDARRRVQRRGGRPRPRAAGAHPPAVSRSVAAVQLRRRGRDREGACMGLISGLLTLPLAPVRGTVWIAERVLEQAESEFYDERAIRAQLLEIDAARAAGEIDEQSAAEAENALIERLISRRA